MNIYAFADEAGITLSSQIAAMQRNRLHGIEIRNVDGTNVSDLTAQQAREIRKQLDEAGLVTWSIGSPIGKIDIEKDDFNAHLAKLQNTLEVAHILGSERIRMFSFFLPAGKNPADYRQCVIDRLGVMLQMARK